MKRKKAINGITFNEPAPNLAIRHTMTNGSREQQHCCCCWCCCCNSSIGTHREAAAAAAACIHFSIAKTTPQSSSYILLHW